MLEGRGVNQTDTWIKTPGRRLVHFSDKPTIRPSDGIQSGQRRNSYCYAAGYGDLWSGKWRGRAYPLCFSLGSSLKDLWVRVLSEGQLLGCVVGFLTQRSLATGLS